MVLDGEKRKWQTEHVNTFKRGVTGWNQWRYKHPGIQPDLSGADLIGANLSNANPSANLGDAILSNALQLHFKADQ